MSTSLSLCRGAALAAAAPSALGGPRLRVRLPARRGSAAVSAGGFRGVGFTLTYTCLSMAPPPKPKVVTMLACFGDEADTDAEAEAEAEAEAKAKAEAEAKAKEEAKEAEKDAKAWAEALATRDHPYYSFEDENDDQFLEYYADLSKETENPILTIFIERPIALSEEESVVQNKLKEIAERGMDLQADAMRRLRPEQRRPLYLVFRTAHFAFVSVRARALEGHANWAVSSLLLVQKLDVLRKMVSSACGAPLPLDRDDVRLLPPPVLEAIAGLGSVDRDDVRPPLVQEANAGLGGVDSNNFPQEVAFALVEYTYNTVKSDIDEMITASDATSTTTS